MIKFDQHSKNGIERRGVQRNLSASSAPTWCIVQKPACPAFLLAGTNLGFGEAFEILYIYIKSQLQKDTFGLRLLKKVATFLFFL